MAQNLTRDAKQYVGRPELNHSKIRLGQKLNRRLRNKLLRAAFILSAVALEATWIIGLCVGALTLYEWVR